MVFPMVFPWFPMGFPENHGDRDAFAAPGRPHGAGRELDPGIGEV